MNDQQWLTAADAAKVLKVTTRQVHRYAEHGQLVTRRAGRRVLFSAASVAQLADDLAVDIGDHFKVGATACSSAPSSIPLWIRPSARYGYLLRPGKTRSTLVFWYAQPPP